MNWRFKAVQQVALDVYNWLVPLATINILWAILSLTLVLMPPATAALYEIAFRASQGEGPYIQDYLAALRRWLVRSWVWGGVSLFLAFVSGFAVDFYISQQSTLGVVLLVASGTFIVFIWLMQFYFWPYMFLQDHPRAWQAARNAAFTVLGDPLFVLAYVILTSILLVLSALLVIPFVLITPVIIAFLGIYSLRDWLSHHGYMDTATQEH